jgi:hypothetical protein
MAKRIVVSVDRLYWDNSGRVECGKHVPYPGSDTWVRSQYSEVPLCDETRGLKCEVCGKARVLVEIAK